MRAKKYRVVNKARFIISIVILTVLFVSIFSLMTNTYKAHAMKEVKYLEVIVNSGDTVWDIAKEYRNEKQDVRELVYIILEVNEIENSMIYEGQIIRIPIS
ncbi:LysM peptidoglycan-binding domain-containing protein [Clostridiaceae bacterium HSG29]|nr:LysM peptidoglycan-binding domain-containing protein [Clostridiaceae bacterium HSG29]